MDNEVTVVGRLARDPEMRFVGEGVACTSLRILQTPRVRKGDQWTDGDTNAFDATAWRQLGEKAAMLPKGMLVRVTGDLQEDHWEKDGEPRSKHKINVRSVEISLDQMRDLEVVEDGVLQFRWKGGANAPARPTPKASRPEPDEDDYDEKPF